MFIYVHYWLYIYIGVNFWGVYRHPLDEVGLVKTLATVRITTFLLAALPMTPNGNVYPYGTQ